MLKVLVVDDEPLARDSIIALLQSEKSELQIIQADNGEDALDIAWREQPDLVFLDIQMPGMTGVEVASSLPEATVVVFTTAYDEYAVKAFELNAVDYLLKPFKNARFFEALSKAKQQVEDKQYHSLQLLQSLEGQLQGNKTYKSRIVVKEPKRVRIVNIDEVLFIRGAGNYAELHLSGGRSILYRETLSQLETQLDPSEFRRIHRSTIIRISSISELQPNYQGDYSVLLNNGDKVVMSRRYRESLQDLIG